MSFNARQMHDRLQFDRAEWRLATLVPAWTSQIAGVLALMGIFSYRLAETVENYEENDKKGRLPVVEVVWECVNISLSLISLVLSILEITRVASETLTPMTILFTHIIKLTCAVAILALDIVVYVTRSEGEWSTIGLVIDCGLIVSTLGSGIYAAAVYQRLLKYEDYYTPDGKGGAPFIQVHPPDAEYGHKARVSSRPDQRRSRASSLTDADTSYSPRAQQRDRADGSFKDEVDRAIGTEFGWGRGSPKSAVVRSGSVVASGVVPVPTGRPEAGSFPRTASWASERALMGVPEEEAGEAGEAGEGDRQALLSREGSPHGAGSADIGLVRLESRKRRRDS